MNRRVFLTALLASTALARPGFANFGHRRVNAVGGGGSDVFIIAFQVKNTGVGSVATPQVSFYQPLAPGALTSGNKLELRASNGVTTIPMQQDQEPSWQSASASLKGAAISFVSPDTFAAGQTITYRLYSVPGSANRTPAVSLAQLAANSDFKMQFTGQDLGADTFQVKVNDVITDNNNFPWGSNPMQGYEVIRSGPICTEWRFWSYLRRTSDSAWHRWIKGWIYVRAWGVTGPWEVSCGVRQSNILGPSASGTVGAIPEPKHAFDVTILDGATVLQRWGGASDTRVQAVSSAVFNPTTNLITLSSSNVLTNGSFGGMAVTLSGTVGAGLSTSTLYWLASNGLSTTEYFLAVNRTNTNGPSALPVDFTTSGSGTINIIPHACCFPFTGQMYLDNTARPIWRGATRPTIAVGHDFTYLTQQTKAIPPYIPGLTMNAVASADSHSPGQQIYPWNLNGTGADPDDERIGYLNVSESRSLYIPFDENNNQQCRVLAASFAEQHIYLEDETVGVIPTMNNGHAKDGVTYTGMGVCRPATRAVPYQGSNIPAWLAPSAAAIDYDGIYEQYGPWMGSGTHCPMPGIMPYLHSGDDFWREYMLNLADMNMGNGYYGSITIGANTYYRPITGVEQVRGVGWSARLTGQTMHLMPAASPVAQYWSDICRDEAGWLSAWRQTNVGASGIFPTGTTTNLATIGGAFWIPQADGINDQGWQNDIVLLCLGMEAWRNEFPGWADFLNNYHYKYTVGRYDSTVGLSGCRFTIGERYMATFSAVPVVQTNWNSIWQATATALAGSGGLPNPWVGCPATGLATDPAATVISGANSIVNYGTMGLALWSILNGGAGATTLYNQVRTIQYAAGLSFTDFPQFAIAPLGAVS